MGESFDVITVWRGRDSATYLAKDFEKYGDEATPLWVHQYPGVNTPFNKIKLEDVDALIKHHTVSKKDLKKQEGSWDTKIMEKLITANSIKQKETHERS